MKQRHRFLMDALAVVVLAAALGLIATGAQTSLAADGIIYVDEEAVPGGDGTSWETAYTDLQLALSDAETGDQIWVAAGTYKPTDGTDRTISFQMKNGVAIYGGFAGTETELGQRDWVANPTILSGDIGTEGDPDDNSYHVFYHPDGSSLDSTAILDGFTITGGNANGSYPHDAGGGMFNDSSSPTLTNITFSGNSADAGGGMLNFSSSSPALVNCRFAGNSARIAGGGMYNSTSSPTLTNCTFSANSAGDDGGGMLNSSSSPVLTNCTFARNSAGSVGGGMSNYASSPTLINCILWGDASPEIHNVDSSPIITYSDIQGGCSSIPGNDCGDGNIDDDPLFVDADNGDLRLMLASPAIDAGNNAAPDLAGITTDLDGNPRFAGIVDMGAYEAPPEVIHVDLKATGDNNGTSWEHALTGLQAALSWAQQGVEIWVAAGTYNPTWLSDAGDPRSATFQMVNGVGIYGGFDPSEGDTEWEDRDWAANPTILSGNIGIEVNPHDNSYHVFYHPEGTNLDSSAILDGFTITGGYADGDALPHDSGGGMFNDQSSPTLANCTFTGNLRNAQGGGMFNHESSPVLTNCTFAGNSNRGMYNDGSSPTLTNCTFAGNSNQGMYNDGSSPTLTNCTFTGNTVGGIYNVNSSPTLTNCILWEDDNSEIVNVDSTATVTYSDIQGGCDADPYNVCGDGNIDTDPLFVDPGNGDLHLGLGSPCIDAGTNDVPDPPGLPDEDFEGDPRIFDGDRDGIPVVDMGADERYEAPPPVIFVDIEATGANDGRSWADALTSLTAALLWAEEGVEVWVAAGLYTPAWESSPGDPRTASFRMVNGVAIYGGFDPSVGDIAWEDRDWAANPTILSGDLDGDDGPDFANNDDNSYHVFYHPAGIGLDSSAVLDGFTITGGNASGPEVHSNGGGMFNEASSPALTNCTFAGNSATHGGGMMNYASAPTLTNCTFYGNSASYGGGMDNLTSSPTLTNCTFTGNTAEIAGGGMYNEIGSEPKLTNCILWGDTAAGLPDEISGDLATAAYSDIQGDQVYPGTGNIMANPLFVDAAAGNLRLQLSSPAIDAGNNDATGITTDLGGHPRFADVLSVPDTGNGTPPLVDMGAYEAPPEVIYVDLQATGDNNGTSWEHALTDLQPALSWAVDGVEVWVAAGTYKPTWQSDAGDPRSATFQMVNGVAIYGGFDPSVGDTEWEDRDWAANPTILSGDIGAEGEPVDNSYHVFYHPDATGLDSSAVLDGFTITGANADGTYPHNRGGGMFNRGSSPTLTNCTFSGNSGYYGGGMENYDSSPTLTNCTLSGNSATWLGGGMTNWFLSPTLTNCTFSGNSSDYGGGMFNQGSSPTLTNCTFSGNSATYGGGIHNFVSSPALTNCTFSGNSAPYGGGISNIESSSPTLTNCILWGDDSSEIYSEDTSAPAVTYSDIQGGYDGEGNIDADPLFVDPDNGDLHLAPGSPCIDAGTNDAALPDYDFEGDPRILDGDRDGAPVVDMGADERYEAPPPVIFVDLEATGANDGRSWADALTSLQAALVWAEEGVEVWVAAGTYKPTWQSDAGDPRSATFQMVNGVAIYGGFDPSAGDTEWEDRDWAANPTILSGDIGTEGDPADNSYHVFYHPDATGLDSSAVLDGFTITGGNADGEGWPHYRDRGGGMYNSNSSPTLTNCTFTGNLAAYGGGMENYDSSPTLTNCTFSGNSAEYGGGMTNWYLSPTLTNCTFSGNSAISRGGGMYNENSSPTLTNCTFAGNSASSRGGGMFNDSAWPTLTNCILWGDTAGGLPDEIYNDDSTPEVTYSDVQGGCDGEGNIDADPLFVDPDNGDFHLAPGSPCIDAGTNDADLPPYDFEGDPRIIDGDSDGDPTVDMGVDEAWTRVYLPLVLRGY